MKRLLAPALAAALLCACAAVASAQTSTTLTVTVQRPVSARVTRVYHEPAAAAPRAVYVAPRYEVAPRYQLVPQLVPQAAPLTVTPPAVYEVYRPALFPRAWHWQRGYYLLPEAGAGSGPGGVEPRLAPKSDTRGAEPTLEERVRTLERQLKEVSPSK